MTDREIRTITTQLHTQPTGANFDWLKVKYPMPGIGSVPTAYVLLNSDLGSDATVINEVKELLVGETDVSYEIQGVYGVYDIVLKLMSEDTDNLRHVITNKVRKIPKVQSTLTMMVIEEQDGA